MKHLAIVCCLCCFSMAAVPTPADWSTAHSIARSIFDLPSNDESSAGTARVSTVADQELGDIQISYAALMADKTNATKIRDYKWAVRTMQENLPDVVSSARIQDVVSKAKVQAAVDILFDFVDSVTASVPVTAASTRDRRLSRARGTVPSAFGRVAMLARWKQDVCKTETACLRLVK